MRITEHDLDFSTARTKRDIFRDTFPDGADVTVENARKATRAGLSLRCAARQIMGAKQYAAFLDQAAHLLRNYRLLTAETREALKLAYVTIGVRMTIVRLKAEHEANKRIHWEPYLDRLAEAFVGAVACGESSLGYTTGLIPNCP